MNQVELIFDGWTRRYIGSKGVILRRNPEHIERCIRAIRNRHEDEVEIRIEEQKNDELQSISGRGRVIPLEVGKQKRKDNR
jgi:hypothetical protein